MRVIISTQGKSLLRTVLITAIIHEEPSTEPTAIPPVLLDLCMISIMHRFSSPAWWEHLVKHVSADFSGHEAFDKIVTLGVSLYSIVNTHVPSLMVLSDRRGSNYSAVCSGVFQRARLVGRGHDQSAGTTLHDHEDAGTCDCRWRGFSPCCIALRIYIVLYVPFYLATLM